MGMRSSPRGLDSAVSATLTLRSHASLLARSKSMSSDVSDAQALRRLRRDPDAIVALYDRHIARLVAALASASGDRQLAFDLAQETFARVLEVGHRVRLEPDRSAWPWLWTVALNLLRDSRRRDAVERRARARLGIATVPYDEEALDELISRVDAAELREEVRKALGELPYDQRQAIAGRLLVADDYASLSALTGTTEQALRARVSRGLRALRLRLSGGRP
jgi:RNA polymerase sigma factor (sigma-70 family)